MDAVERGALLNPAMKPPTPSSQPKMEAPGLHDMTSMWQD